MSMIITGRGRYARVDVTGWTPEQIAGAALAVEIDGYDTRIEAL